jgi:hypothetical protein
VVVLREEGCLDDAAVKVGDGHKFILCLKRDSGQSCGLYCRAQGLINVNKARGAGRTTAGAAIEWSATLLGDVPRAWSTSSPGHPEYLPICWDIVARPLPDRDTEGSRPTNGQNQRDWQTVPGDHFRIADDSTRGAGGLSADADYQ